MKLDEDTCIRLYDQGGRHVLSLVACHEGVDISTPDGEVLFCDQANDLAQVLEVLQGCERPVADQCRQLPLHGGGK